MSFVKHGVVLPLGASGDFDDGRTYTPAVVVRDGRTWLYYSGHDGATERVGLAVSEDGVHFVKHGVVIPSGASGDFDDGRIYAPAVVVRDGRTWLYYSGHDGATTRVGLAVSEDGVHFVKHGVVIPLGASGDFDDAHIYTPAVVVRDGRTWLYYTGNDGGSERVGLAVSEDGVHFVKHGVVIPLGASGDFDDGRTYTPAVVVRDGRTWLYYSGHDGAKYRVGLAVSEDGVHFTKHGVVIPSGASGDFDDGRTYTPAVVVRDGRTWLYYTGNDGGSERVGLAVSEDGF